MATQTISVEVALFLEGEELMGPVTNGKRTISVSALSSPSVSRAPSSSRNISSARFSATFTSQPQSTIEIPAELESIEAYEYIGFNSQTASQLWSHYSGQKGDRKHSFMNIARTHVRDPRFLDVIAFTEEWASPLKGLGIKQHAPKCNSSPRAL